MNPFNSQQILDAGLVDWRKLAEALHTRFAVPDYRAAAQFIAAVGEVADEVNHHPDIRLTYGVLDLSLVSHDAGRWVTQKDVDLARTISRIAAEHGLVAQPSEVAQLELALDTTQADRVAPFWAALLTGSSGNRVHDAVLDPTGRVPSVWFQTTDGHENPRQRWHLDVWLAAEVVQERIAAAVAAGGQVLTNLGRSAFTVLADPDGNRACICVAAVGRN